VNLREGKRRKRENLRRVGREKRGKERRHLGDLELCATDGFFGSLR
jgi:hypothetical protein